MRTYLVPEKKYASFLCPGTGMTASMVVNPACAKVVQEEEMELAWPTVNAPAYGKSNQSATSTTAPDNTGNCAQESKVAIKYSPPLKMYARLPLSEWKRTPLIDGMPASLIAGQ